MKAKWYAVFGVGMIILVLSACSLPGLPEIESTSLPTGTQETVQTPALSTATVPIEPTASLTVPAVPTLEPTMAASPIPATSTLAPTSTDPLPTSFPGGFAVILVEEGDVLNVRQAAGISNQVVASLDPHVTGITLTGKETFVGSDRWVEINIPQGGKGWVNAIYLTEYLDPNAFCTDPTVTDLLGRLNAALTIKDGELLSSIVSPAHGMFVHYFHNGNFPNYTPEEARWVFESTYITNWGTHPASGLEVRGTFHEEVLPRLEEVFSANYQLSCNQIMTGGVSYDVVWPYRYGNINFLSVMKPATPGIDFDWRTWLVGVEYVDDKPYIFSLIQFFWEP